MSDGEKLTDAARAARAHVDTGWDAARVELLLQKTQSRGRRRSIVRATSLAAAAMLAVAIGATLSWWDQRPTPEIAEVVETPAPARPLARFGEGSSVLPLTDDAEVIVSSVSSDRIALELRRGGARFDVTRSSARAFVVETGAIEVSVLGTVFDVYREPPGARVAVRRGRVRVRWPGGEAVLSAGEERSFDEAERVSVADPRGARAREDRPFESPPPESTPRREPPPSTPPASPAPPAALTPVPLAPPPPSRPRAAAPPRVEAPPAWVALAEQGSFEEAAAAIAEDERLEERGDLHQLLLAADTMRLTGQPDRALALLDRAGAVAEGDARAPLVAFTRGRLLLTSLARPLDAAEAFSNARALAPEGSLASDALAREVEARARANDTEGARRAAEEYLTAFPNGIRAASVRRWGGLSTP